MRVVASRPLPVSALHQQSPKAHALRTMVRAEFRKHAGETSETKIDELKYAYVAVLPLHPFPALSSSCVPLCPSRRSVVVCFSMWQTTNQGTPAVTPTSTSSTSTGTPTGTPPAITTRQHQHHKAHQTGTHQRRCLSTSNRHINADVFHAGLGNTSYNTSTDHPIDHPIILSILRLSPFAMTLPSLPYVPPTYNHILLIPNPPQHAIQ